MWVLCAGSSPVSVYDIARYGDILYLPPLLALVCVGSTLIGVALAWVPAGLVAQASGEFVWKGCAVEGTAPHPSRSLSRVVRGVQAGWRLAMPFTILLPKCRGSDGAL
jgi:hypothetical protein